MAFTCQKMAYVYKQKQNQSLLCKTYRINFKNFIIMHETNISLTATYANKTNHLESLNHHIKYFGFYSNRRLYDK